MNKKVSGGGLGLLSTLTLIFLVLKLSGLVSWSWVWVLSPIWISALLFAAVFCIIMVAGRLKKGKW